MTRYAPVSGHPAIPGMRAMGSKSVSVWGTSEDCLIIVSRDPMQTHRPILAASDDGFRWHLSISHPDRYPTWDQIKHARYALLEDVEYMVMILPPKSEYVNIHENCFHLNEFLDGDRVSETAAL